LAQSVQQQQQHWSIAPLPSLPVPSQLWGKQQKSPVGDRRDEMENMTNDKLNDADNDVDLEVEKYEDPAVEVDRYNLDVVEVGSGSDEELNVQEEGGRIILLWLAPQQRVRKKNSNELKLEDVPSMMTSLPSSTSASARSGTSPKRAHIDTDEHHWHQHQELLGREGMLRKWSSKEVEEGLEGERELEGSWEVKKCRVLEVEVDEELEKMVIGIKMGMYTR
ncbi:hypothetical protein H0H87_001445, partial [Tephrocybe sp. NHM501043]